MERKSCASFRYQTDSENDKDEIYADIRESYFTNNHRGTYKCIDPECKGRNTYRELKLKSTRRGRNRDGRNRDKLQTLNSFCNRTLQDVDKLKSEEILTEWALLKIFICGQKLECLNTHAGMNCTSFFNIILIIKLRVYVEKIKRCWTANQGTKYQKAELTYHFAKSCRGKCWKTRFLFRKWLLFVLLPLKPY